MDSAIPAGWFLDLERNILEKVNIGGTSGRPTWSPDGKSLVIASTVGGAAYNLYLMSSDGSPQLKKLTTSDNTQIATSWLPDGEGIIFVENDPQTLNDIWVLPLVDQGEPHLFRGTQYDETQPMLSPDGKWIVYRSNSSGQNEIYIEPFPGPGSIRRVSREEGTEPVWAKNGREIFYRVDSKVMRVSVEVDPELTLGTPELLFEGSYETNALRSPNYDVTSDGDRFLMIRGAEGEVTSINVVLNWFEELKRLVPTQ